MPSLASPRQTPPQTSCSRRPAACHSPWDAHRSVLLHQPSGLSSLSSSRKLQCIQHPTACQNIIESKHYIYILVEKYIFTWLRGGKWCCGVRSSITWHVCSHISEFSSISLIICSFACSGSFIAFSLFGHEMEASFLGLSLQLNLVHLALKEWQNQPPAPKLSRLGACFRCILGAQLPCPFDQSPVQGCGRWPQGRRDTSSPDKLLDGQTNLPRSKSFGV